MIPPGVKADFEGSGVKFLAPRFRSKDNASLLQAGIDSIKARLSRGIGQDDRPTKPLSPRYAKRKQRQYGRPPVRDMRLTGKTLDALKVRYADDGQAVADTAVFDSQSAELLQLSDNDQAAINARATEIFSRQISRLTVSSRRTDFDRRTSFERS